MEVKMNKYILVIYIGKRQFSLAKSDSIGALDELTDDINEALKAIGITKEVRTEVIVIEHTEEI